MVEEALSAVQLQHVCVIRTGQTADTFICVEKVFQCFVQELFLL